MGPTKRAEEPRVAETRSSSLLATVCTRRPRQPGSPWRAGPWVDLCGFEPQKTWPRRTWQPGLNEGCGDEQMNGRRAECGTKACKMAFSRTARVVARPRPGRGPPAPGTLQHGPRGRTKARNMAGSRTPGPAPSRNGSRASRAWVSAAQNRGDSRRVLGPAGPAMRPGPLTARPARAARAGPTQPALGARRETEASSDCGRVGSARGPRGFPPAFPT